MRRIGGRHRLSAEVAPDRQPCCPIGIGSSRLWPRRIGQPIEESIEFDATLGRPVAVAVAALLTQQCRRERVGIVGQPHGSLHQECHGQPGAADVVNGRPHACHHQGFSPHGAPIRHNASQHPAAVIRPGCFPSGGIFISTNAQSGSFGVCRAFETSSSSRNVIPELSTT